MSTLNARAQEAWRLVEAESEFGFEADEEAFEEGWETGYKTRDAEIRQAVEIAAQQWEKNGGPAGQQVVEVLRSMFRTQNWSEVSS